MSAVFQKLKSKLRGTWMHRAVLACRDHAPETRDFAYNRQTVEVMLRILRQDSSCIDVGAHAGGILQHMIEISPRGRHYAFEPLPHLAKKLTQKFPQVIVHEAAVGERRGESEFLFVENDPGYSGLRRRIYDRPDPKITAIRVRVVTLDETIPRNEKIDFIKIDIEGGEFHALKGGTATIARCSPVIVFEAGSRSTGQYGVKADDLFSLVVESMGYALSTMERWLQQMPPYDREEFNTNWVHGPEYYFIATPEAITRSSGKLESYDKS